MTRIVEAFGIRISVFVFSVIAWGTTPQVLAAQHDDTIAQIRAQLESLSERLKQLESQQQTTRVIAEQATRASSKAPAKMDRAIKTNADLRYRFESFDIEGTPDRHRNRIRARVGIKAPVTETTLLGFELASGSDDPISTNQTLGDKLSSNFSSKRVNIDQAYMRWHPTDAGVDVYAGKFKNPLVRVAGNGLLWDGDLRPEGFAAKYSKDQFFVNALGTWVNESKSGDDVLLLGAQAGMKTKLFESSSLTAGVGFYQYTGIEDSAELMPVRSGGNRLTEEGRYLSGFDLLEGFAEISTPTSFGKTTIYADYVKNVSADDYDTAYIIGAKLGIADWSLGWAYEEIEADSVYAKLTDSDFAGGGTDAKGHKLQASYIINKNVKLAGTLFLNDRGMDFGDEDDYQRFMFDLIVKY